jgi:hypothetical protein
MSELKEVIVMIDAPADGSPDRVSDGRYAIEDGKIVMYSEDGEPMTDRRGNRFESELVDGVEPDQIAGLLTRRIRRELGWSLNDFKRPLRLPKEKLV